MRHVSRVHLAVAIGVLMLIAGLAAFAGAPNAAAALGWPASVPDAAAALGWQGSQDPRKKEPPRPGPMLDQGTITLDTPDFTLTLVMSSQTVASLRAKAADGFDFTPGDLLVERS